jgi:hypothetical protein
VVVMVAKAQMLSESVVYEKVAVVFGEDVQHTVFSALSFQDWSTKNQRRNDKIPCCIEVKSCLPCKLARRVW